MRTLSGSFVSISSLIDKNKCNKRLSVFDRLSMLRSKKLRTHTHLHTERDKKMKKRLIYINEMPMHLVGLTAMELLLKPK